VTVFSLLATACGASSSSSSSKSANGTDDAVVLPLKGPAKRTEENSPAPKFSLAAMNESVFRAETPPERPVLILFFAAGHYESAKALPQLHQLFNSYALKGLAFAAIAVDKRKAPVEDFVAGTKPYGWRFPLAWDDGRKVSAQYTITDLPTFYLVDEKGKIVLTSTGFDCDSERKIKQAVHRLLNEPPSVDN
jgi:peroxiredoxin